SDTRVEIILPTGGRHRAEAQEEKWKELIAKVEKEWPQTTGKLSARRGDTAALSQQVNEVDSKIPAGDVDKFLDANWTADKEQALTGEEVERIKDLIQRVGSLEFRILANRHDDEAAVKAAKDYFKAAADSWKEFLGKVKA